MSKKNKKAYTPDTLSPEGENNALDLPSSATDFLVRNGLLALLAAILGVVLIVVAQRFSPFFLVFLFSLFYIFADGLFIYRWRQGCFFHCVATCTDTSACKNPTRRDCEFLAHDDSGRQFIFTLEYRSLREFRRGGAYDMIFRRDGRELSTRNFSSAARISADADESAGYIPEQPDRDKGEGGEDNDD